jgi:hypothetical protein
LAVGKKATSKVNFQWYGMEIMPMEAANRSLMPVIRQHVHPRKAIPARC